jgi:hypothetical protein
MRTKIAGIAACFAMIAALCATPDPAPAANGVRGVSAAPKRPTAHPSSRRHIPSNRHIHSARSPSRTTYEHGRTASPGLRRTYWSGHSHVPVQRGTITGYVSNANGPVAAALVRLAKPGGRRIKNPHARHMTSTTSGGTFSMQMVKVGRYRVVASRAKMGRGHAQVRVLRAGVEHVNIKLGGAKKSKRKK